MDDNIAVVAEWIRHADNIVAFTGAGISTPSGIPDFRSEDSGLWENVDPQEVASIYGFRKNPKAFFDWVRPLTQATLDALPNPAHYALVKLEEMGKLRAVITQNIDMLHTKAGTQSIFELHGHMRTATCINCFKSYDGQPIITQLLNDATIPHCSECHGVLKPDVILFGEQLPYEQMRGAKKAAQAADLMLIIGSSLEVAPASDIPLIAKRNGAKLVIINLEPTIMDRFADKVIIGDAADLLPEIMTCLNKVL
ncbi:MAG: NAD-dependent deacylase [Phototrophicaceae bacterium]